MAWANKTTTLYSSSGDNYTLAAGFSEGDIDTASNTVKITATALLTSNGGSWSSGTNSILTVYWHDNREDYDRQVASISFSSINNYGSKKAEATITVTHKDDGTLSGYAKAVFTKGGTSIYTPSSGNVSTDWTTLTKINRYPVLTSGTNFTDRTNPVYTITAYNTYPLRVKLEAGGNSQLITRDLESKTSQTYTLELTSSERKTLRSLSLDGKTLAVRETVCALSGSTELSSSYKDYTMTIERKPAKIRINGELVDAYPYVRVSGEWIETKPHIRISGEWKEEI